MPQYKNISGQDLQLPGIGMVKADEVIEQPDGFNNANFEKVGEADVKKNTEAKEEESSEEEE